MRLVDADEIRKQFDPNTWQGEMMIAITDGLPSIKNVNDNIKQIRKDKLFEYESTGLSPDVCKNYKLFENELISKGITFKELLDYIDKLHKEKQCGKCKWYSEFEGVCCNGDSEHRADFRNSDDTCDKFKVTKSCEVATKWFSIDNVPTEDGEYLITRKLFGNNLCVVSCMFTTNLYSIDEYDFCGRKNIKGFYDYDSETGYYEIDWNDVVAYMPLPKAYESDIKQ